jgi:gluconolactonase
MNLVPTSPRFHELVPAGAALEKIADGFQFTEGPVWNAREGCLLFSDILGNRIYRWSPRGGVSVWREPSGMSNGLTFDAEGRLCACEHGNRRVSRTEADGTVVTLADRFEGKRLNSPNDLVFRSDGTLYFTDPPYGLTPPYGLEGQQAELDFHGLFLSDARRQTPVASGKPDASSSAELASAGTGDWHLASGVCEAGVLRLATGDCDADFDRPNGLAFSPDEKILYVADTSRYHIRAFDVAPDGSLSGGRIFAELRGEGGRPDGMKVDSQGNVWCTGPGGVWVFSPEGEPLGRILVPERQTANVAWGQEGRDARSGRDPAEPWTWLYMTSHVAVYRLRVAVSGFAGVWSQALGRT